MYSREMNNWRATFSSTIEQSKQYRTSHEIPRLEQNQMTNFEDLAIRQCRYCFLSPDKLQ